MENLQSLIQPRCCSMFILKVLELFYIKKGLCFPNAMLSLLITSRRSQCISHVMLFLVTHIALNYQAVQWATERVVEQNWWAVEHICYKRRWDPPWSWWKPSAALPCSLHLDQDPTAAGSEQWAHGLSDSFEIWTWFQIFHFSGKLPLFKINEEFSFYGDTLPKWPLLSNSETFPIFPLITTHNMRQEFLSVQFLLL